jgi:4-amino-4-deoxy-L-arabinose transferase-like glycosyltransferase
VKVADSLNSASLLRPLRNQALAPLFPLLVGLLARLVGIGSRPLWYDEAFSVLFSEKGPSAMLVGTLSATSMGAADVHPLTYYSLLWAWMHAFGESPVAVRALSIIIGLAVILLVYILARDLFDHRTALAAAFIAALSPFQVHYAQEIRMYGLLALWLLLATWCYWQGSRSLRWPWWLGFAVFAALAQYTHNLAAFYLVALALWPLLRREWRTVRRVMASGVLAMLLYLPWFVHLPSQFAKVDLNYWVDRPGLYRLFTLLLYFVTNLPLPGWHLAAGLLVAIFVVVIAIMQTVRAARSNQEGALPGLWLLYLSFAPPLLLFLFSQWKAVYIERALLPSGAVFCVWLAWAVLKTRLPRSVRGFVLLLLAFGFALGLFEHVTYAGFPYAPYASLDAANSSALQPGDVIVHSSKLSMLPAVYYDRALPQTYIADPPGSPEDTLALSTQQVLGLLAKPNMQSATSGASRVLFLIFDESIQEYKQAGYPTDPQLTWLSDHYALVDEKDWGDLHLYKFARTP